MLKLYGMAPAQLSCIAFIVGCVWLVFIAFAQQYDSFIRILQFIGIIFVIASIFGVFSCSVIGRTSTVSKEFSFAAQYTNEFYREMFMNALLYYPLGLSLTVLIGPWSILVAFILSTSIETWQYFAGTGLAQGTDVIMNTLGTAIGAIPWYVVRLFLNRREKKQPLTNQGEE